MDKRLLEPDLVFLFEDIDIALMGTYENHYYEKYKDLKSINKVNQNYIDNNQVNQIEDVFLVDKGITEKFKSELGELSLGVKGEKLSEYERNRKIENLRNKGELKYQVPEEQIDNLFFIINNINKAKEFKLYDKTQPDIEPGGNYDEFFKVSVEIIEQFVSHITYYFNLKREKKKYKSNIRVLIAFILSYCGLVNTFEQNGYDIRSYINQLEGKTKNYVFPDIKKKK